MPPKKTCTREEVVTAAFALVRAHGLAALSARNVARRLKTSTSPIYGHFRKMSMLRDQIVLRAMDLLRSYQTRKRTGEPFFDMGLGYIEFARSEERLFFELFSKADRSAAPREHQFGSDLLPVMKTDPVLRGFSEDQLRNVLLKMWIFVHGIASLVHEGDLAGLSEKEISTMLHQVGKAVVDNIAKTKTRRQTCGLRF